ncbi:class D sortase [Metabacillus sp. HB246100]
MRTLSLFLIILGGFLCVLQINWLSKGYQVFQKENAPASSQAISHASEYVSSTSSFVEGDEIGVLQIPKLERTIPIYEGTDEDTLKKGIGHVSSTPLPGDDSNSVLAGHRDTFFRELDQLVVGDKLIVKRDNTYLLFKIKKLRIVDKQDSTVLVPKPRKTLTLTTCYPFAFIGPAPLRYIVEAELITKPKIERE